LLSLTEFRRQSKRTWNGDTLGELVKVGWTIEKKWFIRVIQSESRFTDKSYQKLLSPIYDPHIKYFLGGTKNKSSMLDAGGRKSPATRAKAAKQVGVGLEGEGCLTGV